MMERYDLRLKYDYADWDLGHIPKGSKYRVVNVVQGAKGDFEVRLDGATTRTFYVPLDKFYLIFDRIMLAYPTD